MADASYCPACCAAASLATLLPDGHVLVAGGFDQTGGLVGAEILDPSPETFRPAGSGFRLRGGHSVTALADGRVLIVGGWEGTTTTDSVQIYDPTANLFTDAPPLPPND